MCDQQSLRSACAHAQSDQSLCSSFAYFMSVKLLTEHHLKFLSLIGGCRGSAESTLVKMSNFGNLMPRLIYLQEVIQLWLVPSSNEHFPSKRIKVARDCMPLGLFLAIKIHNVFTISVTTYLNMLKFHVFSYIPFFENNVQNIKAKNSAVKILHD